LVEEDGFYDFRDVQIFFTAKNLKVLSKRPTLMQTWDDYFMRWEQALDKNYLDPDQVWIDISKEVCAPPSLLWYQDPLWHARRAPHDIEASAARAGMPSEQRQLGARGCNSCRAGAVLACTYGLLSPIRASEHQQVHYWV
jgi:hypothetical protein